MFMSMRPLPLSVAVFFLACSSAFAGVSFLCQNPFHGYNVTYADGADKVVVNPDSDHTVLPVLAMVGSDVLVVDLGQPGMASVLHLTKPRSNEIFDHGKLIQTDHCD